MASGFQRAAGWTRKALGIGAAVAFIAATAAQAQEAPQPEAKSANEPGYVLKDYLDRLPPLGSQCIFFRTLYDWRALNNYNLILWAPTRKQPYHVQLADNCSSLKFAETIGFTSRNSQLCGYGGDAVLVQQGGGSFERCTIGSITALTEDSLKALLTQAPGQKRPPAEDKK